MARIEAFDQMLEGSDVFELDEATLDPKLHYRFCEGRESNMRRRRAQGYEPVLRSVSGVRLKNEPEGRETADDLIRVGGLILMACPKATYDKRREKTRALTRARLDAGEYRFRDAAVKRGVKIVTED